ncbi:hypothetical protein K493DRAFT_299484 [Basidiobolus meristosporus CBS 931.73]|uniref:DUF7137 domain-containing protein n=1 Tax=Basidiobolus meristosporus CBS 931.73 TaxID=1314790 RepID=A0A1Y1YMP8_9FUNG|nr:hypothetical protein K493DRAFT_299484 [Basidiobolus meristosporus CBS 931.73]|eukprot:ORX99265.1 hypothetical protein K493DRAFT_299484 [Basidiobolus meristosporus CBS 931.73]
MVWATKVSLALTVLILASPILSQGVQPPSPTSDTPPQISSPPGPLASPIAPELPIGGGPNLPASGNIPGNSTSTGPIVGGAPGNGTLAGGEKGNSTIIMDPRDPPGRITMVNPSNPATVFPRFAIGDDIHFKWEFDKNLRIPPKELYLLAARISRNLEYPIAFNISGSSKEYIWKTSTWNQTLAPLTEDKDYILQIYDERGLKAVPEAGRLAIFRMPFGLYRRGGGDPFCTACLSNSARTSPVMATSILALLLLWFHTWFCSVDYTSTIKYVKQNQWTNCPQGDLIMKNEHKGRLLHRCEGGCVIVNESI